MLLLIASLAVADPAPAAFPERTPGLIEACLQNALNEGQVSETDHSHKYICSGEVAERFWAFLEKARIEPWEQDAGADGHWLSLGFPLGGCFKRTRMADDAPFRPGLSCTIWILRAASAQ